MRPLKNITLNPLLIVAAIIFVGLISAAYFSITYRHVDESVSLASPPLPSRPNPLHRGLTFRVAIAAMLSPVKNFKVYQDLADLLAREFGLPLEIITRDTYAEVNELLRNGEVDVAFVCTGGYASAPDAMDVIAAPVINGRAEYYALIIVPRDSPAQSIEDLRGKSFLFTDPDSNTGCRHPRERLRLIGETSETFFSEIRWTGSHDRSILAVSQRLAQGASVDSLIFDAMLVNDDMLAGLVRILERSHAYPSPPVVVRKTMSIPQRKQLVHILVQLSETAKGRAILKGIGVDGFTPANNSAYQSLEPPPESPQ